MIKYRATVLWLFSLVFATIHPAEAQQLAKKVTRIGVLSPGALPLGPLEAFRQTLRGDLLRAKMIDFHSLPKTSSASR
jgi:hypothetical protein